MQNQYNQGYGYPPQQPQGYAPAGYYPPGQSMPPAQVMNQPMMPMQMQMHNPQVIMVSTNGGAFNPAMEGAFPQKQIPDHVPLPQSITCVHCSAKGSTIVNREFTGTGWCICILLCLCFWPCFWIAFLIDASYRNVHTCPNCRQVVSYTL